MISNVRQRDVSDLDILVAPLVEQLDRADLCCHLLGQDLVAGDSFDFDISVGHAVDCARPFLLAGCREKRAEDDPACVAGCCM